MTLLLICEVAVLAAAIRAMVSIRRKADAAWAEHLRTERFGRLTREFNQLKIELQDRFTPALKRAGEQIAELIRKLEG